jgi:hypothetical protein
MDIMALVVQILTFIGQIPVVGHYLQIVVEVALLAGPVVSALIAIWHAAVMSVQALSKIPGLSSLGDVATKMKANEDIIDDFSQSKILPILNQISSIPLPKK